ncbi:MAG: porin family protein [Gemmatimonadota bacterium]|nr:porin family protein [Gemmatimonadota bacterium]MDH4348994.1 porin family protein [Gemmatimonadota bacterium]MDH5284198.1 porin family protein [Gemmatimonadota bacterium]
MMRRLVCLLAVLAFAAPLAAQSGKFEISPFVGYSLSDGFDVPTFTAPGNGRAYNGFTFKDGLSYGASLGYYVNPVTEIEFMWSRQESQLQGERVSGGSDDAMDVAIDNYHANFVYNMYNDRRKLRPFFLFGLGATVFYPDDYQGKDLDTKSYFSGKLGAGLKYAMNRSMGLKLQVNWTPTYITSTNKGYWCDPWYGCWTIGDAQYENQFGFTAALNWRFGS